MPKTKKVKSLKKLVKPAVENRQKLLVAMQ